VSGVAGGRYVGKGETKGKGKGNGKGNGKGKGKGKGKSKGIRRNTFAGKMPALRASAETPKSSGVGRGFIPAGISSIKARRKKDAGLPGKKNRDAKNAEGPGAT
jgi:hypothetical protein